jgi:citrate lyase subunit beta/citryl-CoA lyase
MPIIPIVESALGLAAIEAMMMHPSVLQCAFGHLDFSLDIGADPQWDSLHYARGKIVVASRLGQKAPPLDGVAVRFDDAEIVAGEARRAREMGFGGKLLIHPKQIAPAKAVFRPSDADYEWAQRVMTAAANSASAVQLDGAMVDVPVIKRAEAIIRDYEALA